MSALFLMMQMTGGMCFANPIPNAGQLLQEQTIPKLDETPTATLPTAVLAPVVSGDQQKIAVKQFIIQGNQQLSDDVLHAQIAEFEAKDLTFSELQQAVNRLSELYASAGYRYSYAFLPAQNLSQGTVRIQVVEALLNGLEVNNHTNTKTWLIDQMTHTLSTQQLLEDRKLNDLSGRLGMLSGVTSQFALQAGESQNETKLKVELLPGQHYQGYIGLDNFGGEYTGEARMTGGVRVNSLMGLGDQLSVDLMSSGSHMQYGQLGYAAVVHGSGTKLGAHYSYLDYELAKALANLGYQGQAKETSLWIQQPLESTQNQQSSLQVAYKHKQLEDDAAIAGSLNHRNVDAVQFNWQYQLKDQWHGFGLNQFNISTTLGQLKIKDAVSKEIDAQTRKTQGDFVSVLANASRIQQLAAHRQLKLFAEVFYSPDNLDSSQAYYVGGSNQLRGYESSVFSASQGATSSVELIQDVWSNAEQALSAQIFLDLATLQLNAKTWAGSSEKNTATLSSAGVQANYDHKLLGSFKAVLGVPIGSRPEQLQKRDNYQLWLNWQKAF